MINTKKIIVDYVYIIVGSFILALAINCFLIPLKISTGGISGIGTVLYYVFNIPLSLTVLVVNIVLFLLGYKMLSRSSLVRTFSGIVFLSVFLELTNKLHVNIEDILISSVFGGVLVGIGVGLTVSKQASTGGSDFAALMINKHFPHISLAKIILIIDFFIIVLSGVIFKNYTVMFYSVISLYISSRVTDMILVSGDYAKSIYIISKHNDTIANIIINNLNRGVTGIYSKGYYNSVDTTMLMCIVRSKEIPHLLNKIKEIDKDAFVIISDVREVHGAGFKRA